MITVSVQQARQRFLTLSDSLQDAIFAVKTEELIRQIAEQNRVSQEKIPTLAEVVGLVLLGFLKIEDVGREIQDRIRASPEVVASLASAFSSQIFSPVRFEIDKSYATGKAGQVPPTPSAPIVLPNRNTTSPAQNTSSPTIPASFSRPIESFFKTPSQLPMPSSKEKVAEAAPVIIHSETKAEGLSTVPKLAFRVGDNQMTEAKDRPVPLRPIEFTSPNVSIETKTEAPKREPIGVILKEKLGMSPRTSSSTPVVVTTPNLTTPVAKMSFSVQKGEPSLVGSGQTSAQPAGVFQKIKSVFSKESVATEKSSVLAPKIETPKPPEPPSSTPALAASPSRQKIVPPISIKVPLAVVPGIKTVDTSTVPALPKEPAAPALKIFSVVPMSASTVPTVEIKNQVKPAGPPAMPLAKVDLKKIGDVAPGAIPMPEQKVKSGFFSRIFKKPESALKIIMPATTAPTKPTPPLITKSGGPLTSSDGHLPVPPLPPVPPRTPELPKQVLGAVPQMMPTQKISPLSNLPGKMGGWPPTPPAPAAVKTVDSVSALPKVINYSQYPGKDPTDQNFSGETVSK